MKLVSIDKLSIGMVIDEDVYTPEGLKTPHVRRGVILTANMLREMRRLGVRYAYVRDDRNQGSSSGRSDGESAHSFVVPKPEPIISPLLQVEAIETLEALFSVAELRQDEIHDSAKIVRRLDTVVDQLVDSLQNETDVLINICDLKSYDDYTYHHSLSVAVLSIAIGQYMGFNRRQLQRIGTSAMMHDIGKTAIPIEIINKPGRLTESEFDAIKNHSPAGMEYLIRNGIGDEEMWRSVCAHHEKIDGTGYPDGLKGNEIPLFSRIMAVADVYDALTSNRPYREPMQPAEAFEYVMGGADSLFDHDVIFAFLNRVDLYPVGSRVLLSNGLNATVLSAEHQFRPVVQLDTGEILDLLHDRSCLSLVVSKLLFT